MRLITAVIDNNKQGRALSIRISKLLRLYSYRYNSLKIKQLEMGVLWAVTAAIFTAVIYQYIVRSSTSLSPWQRVVSRYLWIAEDTPEVDILSPVNIVRYISSIASTLKPPVSNRLLYDEDIKVMIVGGPNSRLDFHVEMGEELFYQLKGSMDLDIITNHSSRETITIKEGEMFLLPAGVPHSPQRYPETIGVVFERSRRSHEMDALRWYVDHQSTEVLYEEFFHCTDLGTQIKHVIENFNRLKASTANSTATKTANSDSHRREHNASVDTLLSAAINAKISAPFSLSERIAQLSLSGSSPEEIVSSSFHVQLYRYSEDGVNVHVMSGFHGKNIFLWQLFGNSSLNIERLRPLHSMLQSLHTETVVLGEGEVVMLSPRKRAQQVVLVINDPNSVLMEITSEYV